MDTERLGSESEYNSSLPPIPRESVEGWKDIPVKGINQELVPLGPFTDFSDCDASGVYFGERGTGPGMNFTGRDVNFVGRKVDREKSLLTDFVRRDVFDRLQAAQASLPEGYYFRFYDGFRPLVVQEELYAVQREIIAKQHPAWTAEQIDEETHKSIATPSAEAPHTTGAAIDLGLIRMNEEGRRLLQELEQKKTAGELSYPVKPKEQKAFERAETWIAQQDLPDEIKRNWLAEYRYGIQKSLIFRDFVETVDMGTGFDYFGPEAEMNYYETKPELTEQERQVRDNRRLLYKVMNDAGFLSYPGEWWHFSYGDQEWAANKGQDAALFGPVDLSVANQAMESARRVVYLKTIHDIKTGKKPIFVE